MNLMAQACVIALAEFKTNVRMNDRIAESRENLAAVIHDVAIVQSNHGSFAAGQHVTIRHPALPAFAIGPDLQAVVFERLVETLHARSVVPKDAHISWQYTDPLLHFFELFGCGLRQGKDNLPYVGSSPQLAQDGFHCGLLKFRIEGRSHKGDGLLARGRPKLP